MYFINLNISLLTVIGGVFVWSELERLAEVAFRESDRLLRPARVDHDFAPHGRVVPLKLERLYAGVSGVSLSDGEYDLTSSAHR